MATFDFVNCTHGAFLTYLEESNPKEQTFKSIWEKINTKYVEISGEIYKLNEKRHELLEKVKASQTEYKRLFGLGEIKPVIDANEDEENDNSNVQESKTDKKGRKKNTQTDDLISEIDEELENVPKMKTKEPKKSVKQVKTVKELDEQPEEHNDTGDGEPAADYVPEVVKKGTKKKVAVKKVETTEVVIPEESQVVKPVKTTGRTSIKKTEKLDNEPENEPVKEPKTVGKKKTTK